MNLFDIEINNTCIKCDLCREICPENAIEYENKEYAIDLWSCTLCSICVEICPNDSIKIKANK